MKKIGLMLLLFLTNISLATTPDELTVLLDWSLNPDHAPLIIAQQQGFFKEQNLSVELIQPTNEKEASTLIATRKAEIGLVYEPDYLEQVDQGLALLRFGTLIDKPMNSLSALKSSKITTIADLKGKRIGIADSGLTHATITALLENAGLSVKEVKIIPLKNNLAEALLTHQVDAIMGVLRNHDIPMMEAKHQHLVTFFPEEHGLPNYSELIFITHAKNAHDPRLPRFLAAIKKAVAYLDDHPKQAWLQFAKTYPKANTRSNREVWFSTLPYFAEDPASLDSNEMLAFADFMQKNHLIKTIQPASRYGVIIN